MCSSTSDFWNRYETNLFPAASHSRCRRIFADRLKTNRVRGSRLDLFHMNIEEPNVAEALLDAGALVGHVHFADSNRRAIGMGHTAMGPIIDALRDIGYQGYLSAEILPLPDLLPRRPVHHTMESLGVNGALCPLPASPCSRPPCFIPTSCASSRAEGTIPKFSSPMATIRR